MLATQDQIKGCLVGGAIGDAFGNHSESGEFVVSDDTQMTLATCEGIRECGIVRPEVIANTFSRWFRAGRITGLGSSTLKALRDLAANVHWALAGARGEMAAGNGAAMRIAPLAFLLNPHDRGDRVLIRDICRITHHSDEAYIGALAVLIAIRSAVESGVPARFELIARSLPDSRLRDRIVDFVAVDHGQSIRGLAAQHGASGYVVETVPLALFVANRMIAVGFEGVLTELSEVRGDTDTIGAIAGQVAGAFLGFGRFSSRVTGLQAVQGVLTAVEEYARFVSGLSNTEITGA